MWYVIQTTTGKEEELLLFTGTILSEKLRESCFVIRVEWLKRIGGVWQRQVRPLFPGYVFIETEQPERLFLEIRKVPKYTKLLGTGRFDFVPVREEEESFLKQVSGMKPMSGVKLVSGSEPIGETNQIKKINPAKAGETAVKAAVGQGNEGRIPDPLVRLTTLELSEEGAILSMDGALQYFKREVVRMNLHKRYAVVKTQMLGQERTLLFGLRLKDDKI